MGVTPPYRCKKFLVEMLDRVVVGVLQWGKSVEIARDEKSVFVEFGKFGVGDS